MSIAIKIDEHVYDKVMHWVNKSNKEVSGFGKVLRVEGGFRVIEAYLLEQEVGGAHTDIDGTAMAKLMYQTKDLPGELRWWWHSHVMMSCFWSGTDKDTILDLGKNGWIIATVFNQKNEYRSALSYKYKQESDFGLKDDTAFVDELDLEVIYPEKPANVIQLWDEEFDRCVKEKKYEPPPGVNPRPTYQPPFYGGYGGYGDDYYERDYDRTWNRGEYNDIDAREMNEIRTGNGTVTSNYTHMGMFGYGTDVEAAALGMTEKAYIKKINVGSEAEVAKIESKLEELERMGKLEEWTKRLYGRVSI